MIIITDSISLQWKAGFMMHCTAVQPSEEKGGINPSCRPSVEKLQENETLLYKKEKDMGNSIHGITAGLFGFLLCHHLSRPIIARTETPANLTGEAWLALFFRASGFFHERRFIVIYVPNVDCI